MTFSIYSDQYLKKWIIILLCKIVLYLTLIVDLAIVFFLPNCDQFMSYSIYLINTLYDEIYLANPKLDGTTQAGILSMRQCFVIICCTLYVTLKGCTAGILKEGGQNYPHTKFGIRVCKEILQLNPVSYGEGVCEN